MNKEYNDNREYNEALDALHFSDKTKAALVQHLLDAGEQPQKRRVRRPLPRMAVVGVAAALVLSIGAGATVVYNRLASESFAGVFGTAHTEIVDKIGRPIGASATDSGVTVTADAIIGDKYSYAITYTISNDDGTPFDLQGNEFGYLPLHFEQADTDVGNRGGAHGSSFFIDETPGDNAIQYVELRSVDTEMKKGTAKASFENLLFSDGEDEYTLAKGKWNFKFAFDYEDASISLPAGQAFELNGMAARIDGVTLSPIGYRVDYTVSDEVKWDENAQSGRISAHDAAQSRLYLEDVQLVLTRKDGTTVDLTNSGGGMQPKNGKTVCEKSGLFDEIVPLDEVASLTVGGVEIPLA